MTADRSAERLKVFVPDAAHERVVKLLKKHKVKLRLTKKRVTKLGDYRYSLKHGHCISVNKPLNPYAFLITLIHELAHLKVYIKHKNRVKPHGKAWKKTFKELMLPFLNTDVFPEEILQALAAYLKNPKASSCVDEDLYRIVRKFDRSTNGKVLVEELPPKSVFKTHNGRTFKKGKKLRKRFRCKEVRSNQVYLFSPVAEVYHQKE